MFSRVVLGGLLVAVGLLSTSVVWAGSPDGVEVVTSKGRLQIPHVPSSIDPGSYKVTEVVAEGSSLSMAKAQPRNTIALAR